MRGMDRRELRYFVAVGEELHFGRAARRLGIAQPPLSRAIGRLEQQLQVTLLTRTSRTVALTDAGAVLLAEARAIITAIAVAQRRTRQASIHRPSLTLAAKAGTSDALLATLLEAYAAQPGAVDVDLILCDAHQQNQPLAPRGRRLPGRPRRRSPQPDAALPTDRAGPQHSHRAPISRHRPTPRPHLRTGHRRPHSHYRHRLAPIQPLTQRRRPGPHRHPPLTPDTSMPGNFLKPRSAAEKD